MTPKDRVKAVYEGKIPDQVPLMLDISHWYKKNYNVFFDLNGFTKVDQQLVDLHKKCGAVQYVETGSHIEIIYEDETVQTKTWTDDGGVYFTKITTPLGTISEERVFSRESYSYHIRKWLIRNIQDLAVLEYAMKRRKVRPRFDRYLAWADAAGDLGFIYTALPYSGLGFLISRYMGVENTILAMYDYPAEFQRFINAVNETNLHILDTIINEPFDVLIVGDNHDSSVQSPDMFRKYTFDYYQEIARRVHKHGKYLAVHVDGEMHTLMDIYSQTKTDIAEGFTPAPMTRVSFKQAIDQWTDKVIIWGGIPASLLSKDVPETEFDNFISDLLAEGKRYPFVLSMGDNTPIDADIRRLEGISERVNNMTL